MPRYDFSKVLEHRTGRSFSCNSLGLLVEGIYDDPQSYEKALPLGEMFELLLLYTVDRKPGQRRDDPPRYLTEEEKRKRFATSLKVRDCDVTDITPEDLEMLKTAITVLSTEPNGLVHQFLEDPIE